MINTVFSDNEIPKESIQYICIAAINIDTVMKIDKKKLSSSLSRTMYISDNEENDVELFLNDSNDFDDSNFE